MTLSINGRSPRARRRNRNPFGRFNGTKLELLTMGAAVLAWDYSRASKDDHLTGKSVADQHDVNVFNVDRLGWTLADSFEDNDQGASRQARERGVVREGFERLVRAIQGGAPGDVMVMWELSRRERDMSVYVKIRDLCEQYGPYFWLVAGDLYDVRNRNDRQSLGFQAQFAESQADAIAEGVQRGLKSNAFAGKPHGATPFGYVRHYDPRTRKFVAQVPDWSTSYVQRAAGGEQRTVERRDADGELWSPAGIVAGIFGDAEAGKPIKSIVEGLNRRRIPPPRLHAALTTGTPQGPARWDGLRWTLRTVRGILLNPAFIGTRMYQPLTEDEPVAAMAGAWDGLASPETFYALRRSLTAPERLTTQPSRAKHLCSSHPTIRCECGEVLNYQPRQVPKDGGGHGRQSSANYKCKRNCAAASQPGLDAYVEALVVGILSSPRQLARLFELAGDGDELAAARAEAEKLAAELADVRRRIRGHRPQTAAEREDLDDLEARRDTIRSELAAARAKVVPAGCPDVLRQFIGSDEAKAARLWHDAGRDGVAAQRAIIRRTVRLTIHPVGRGRRTPLRDRVTVGAPPMG